MKLQRIAEVNRPEQYRGVLPGATSEFILYGGTQLMSGPRSNYSADVCCIDAQSLNERWSHKISKSQPFTAAALDGQTLCLAISSNFTRAFTGLQFYRCLDGAEAYSPQPMAVVRSVISLDCRFLSANLLAGKSTAVWIKDGLVEREASLSEDLNRTIAGVEKVNDRGLVVTLQFVANNRLRYEHVFCDLKAQPLFSVESQNDAIHCQGDRAYTYAGQSKQIEVIDLSSGKMLRKLSVAEAGITKLERLEGDTLVWATDDRVLVTADEDSGQVRERHDLNTEYPGWLTFAQNPASRTLAAVSTDNHARPQTQLSFYSF